MFLCLSFFSFICLFIYIVVNSVLTVVTSTSCLPTILIRRQTHDPNRKESNIRWNIKCRNAGQIKINGRSEKGEKLKWLNKRPNTPEFTLKWQNLPNICGERTGINTLKQMRINRKRVGENKLMDGLRIHGGCWIDGGLGCLFRSFKQEN